MNSDTGAKVSYCHQAVLESQLCPYVFYREIDFIIEKIGLSLEKSRFSEDNQDFWRWTWHVPDESIIIELLDDKETATAWIALCCNELQVLEQLKSTILPLIPVQPLENLITEALSLNPNAIVRMAISCNGKLRQDIFEILNAGLLSSNVETRARTVESLYMLKWDTFFPALENVLKNEQDKGIRAMIVSCLNP